MNKTKIALKLLQNKKVRNTAIKALKNKRVRNIIVKQVTRRFAGK